MALFVIVCLLDSTFLLADKEYKGQYRLGPYPTPVPTVTGDFELHGAVNAECRACASIGVAKYQTDSGCVVV